MKLVNKSLVEKEESLANEIDILGSIDHPNVVNMKAIFDTEETLFIVMELYAVYFPRLFPTMRRCVSARSNEKSYF